MSENSIYSYREDDIAIVGTGCVLPGAKNVPEFWNVLQSGETRIAPLSADRWHSDYFYDVDRTVPDKTYSKYGAEVFNSDIEEMAKARSVDDQFYNRLDMMAVESTMQALQDLQEGYQQKRWSISLGLMNPDEAYFAQLFMHEKSNILRHVISLNRSDTHDKLRIVEEIFEKMYEGRSSRISSVLPSSVLHAIRENCGLSGESLLVDAACASSLAAIDIAMKQLSLGQVDYVLTGGVESNLSTGAYVLFSKVGALAPERCLPYDQKTQGLSQGEGTVMFVLQRLADAKKQGNKIHGIIKSSEGSSDGESGSLFQPTVGGQLIAYERAYKDLGTRRVDFIEGHGTGTQIGDETEMNSLGEFFGEFRIPVGSAKAITGHTKGAAGGVSLLKCLLAMKYKEIPPSPYITEQIKGPGHLYVNDKMVGLKNRPFPYRMGVSSLGFGGINYHLVVDEYRADNEILPALKKRDEADLLKQKIVICDELYVDRNSVGDEVIKSVIRLPPNSIPQIDRYQLLSLYGVIKLLKESGIDDSCLDRKNTSVFSSSCIGLEQLENLGKRILNIAFCNRFRHDYDAEYAELLSSYYEIFPEITEDSGPGILNNVIPGRICNFLNLNGKSFNIDMDQNSIPAALKVASNELKCNPGLIIFVGVDESVNDKAYKVERQGVYCALLSTLDYAQKNELPIKKLLGEVNYMDTKSSEVSHETLPVTP